MIKKKVANVDEALQGVSNNMTLMLGGFGLSGIPENAIAKLVKLGVSGLTCISNNAGGATKTVANSGCKNFADYASCTTRRRSVSG